MSRKMLRKGVSYEFSFMMYFCIFNWCTVYFMISEFVCHWGWEFTGCMDILMRSDVVLSGVNISSWDPDIVVYFKIEYWLFPENIYKLKYFSDLINFLYARTCIFQIINVNIFLGNQVTGKRWLYLNVSLHLYMVIVIFVSDRQ